MASISAPCRGATNADGARPANPPTPVLTSELDNGICYICEHIFFFLSVFFLVVVSRLLYFNAAAN